MNNLVAEILNDSQAYKIIEQVQKELSAEEKKRQEFYEIIDEDTKAEFFNGEIHYHSPVKKEHNDAAMSLCKLLSTFVNLHGLGYVGFDKILVQFPRADFEPDVCFFKTEKSKHFKKGQMHFPVPDLAVEVLSSNVKNDREIKFKAYQEEGVQEYWIIDADKEIIEQYVLEKGKYDLKIKAAAGDIASIAVQGFVIPIRAVFDEGENLNVLRQILIT